MAGEAGEKMLTEELRVHLAEWDRRCKLMTDTERLSQTVPAHLAMEHIRTFLDDREFLSATIKRLETPVADGDVEKYSTWLQRLAEKGGKGAVDGDARSFGKVADLLRRQAREIERLKAALGTEQSMHGAWRKRAEEAEIALNAARNIEAEAIATEIESLYKSANEQWNNALTSVRNIIQAGILSRATLSLNSVETRET